MKRNWEIKLILKKLMIKDYIRKVIRMNHRNNIFQTSKNSISSLFEAENVSSRIPLFQLLLDRALMVAVVWSEEKRWKNRRTSSRINRIQESLKKRVSASNKRKLTDGNSTVKRIRSSSNVWNVIKRIHKKVSHGIIRLFKV